jgi:hypothetical protein
MMQRALVIAGIWLTACGPKAEPAKAAEPAPSAVAAAPSPSADKPAEPEAKPPEPAPSSTPVAEAKPAAPSLHAVCFEMCDRVKAKCPKSAFETCQLNCSKYDPAPDGCEDVVRAALACARDAADLVCANVAPESCAKRFRQIAACASGQKPAEAGPATAALPPGFALYENAQEGVQAPMPTGPAAGGEANVVAAVKTADGAVYSIRKLPRPEGKLNEKVFLKLGLNLFGRCSDKMKLQGIVDKPGRTSINYTTKCADGSEEKGLFWATDKALFVASVKGPAGKLGPAEAFLYGFEAK